MPFPSHLKESCLRCDGAGQDLKTIKFSVNGGEASDLKVEDYHEKCLFIANGNNMEMGAVSLQPLQIFHDFATENGTDGDAENSETKKIATENGTDGDAENSETKKMKRSEAWDNFTLEKSPDGSTSARCKQCNILLTRNKNSGTSHLLRHAKFHCKGIPHEVARSRKVVALSSQLARISDCEGSQYNPDTVRRLFAQLLICAGLPFKIVEHPTFINFVTGLQPSYKIFSPEAVRSDCIFLYEEQKRKVVDMLKNLESRLNISYALWSSDKNVIYMAVTAHFIDDNFCLKKKLLSFKQISCLYTPKIFNEDIARCLAEWDLDEKVFALTHDSSSINDVLARRLGEHCNEELHIIENYYYVRSCEHVLSIMASDGISILSCEIERIRKVIAHAASTSSNLQKLNEIAQQFGLATNKGLILDVSRKWNATSDMLQSALPYKKAIDRYAQVYCYGVNAPSKHDWEKIEILTNILKAFVNMNNAISGTKSANANFYFKEVWTIRSLLYDEYSTCDDVIRTLMLNMQQKFNIYWNEYNLALAVAAILDPRFKFLFIQFCYGNAFDNYKAKQNLDRIREYLYKLYHDYERAENTTTMPDRGDIQGFSTTSEYIGKRKIETEFAKFLSKNVTRKLSKNELDTYLDSDVLVTTEDEEFNVLKWWRTNTVNYPVLSKMARDVLAIPISTVASKLAFSAYKRLINQHSIHLDSSTVEVLVCTQDWLNADYYSGEELFESCIVE